MKIIIKTYNQHQQFSELNSSLFLSLPLFQHTLQQYRHHPIFDLPDVNYSVTEHQAYFGECCYQLLLHFSKPMVLEPDTNMKQVN